MQLGAVRHNLQAMAPHGNPQSKKDGNPEPLDGLPRSRRET
jgi:hypothetical protein